VQHEISAQISADQVGQELEVFIEGVSAHEKKKVGGSARVRDGMAALTVGGRSIDERAIAQATGPVQLAGRTDTDLIVLFETPAGQDATGLIGRTVRARVTRANALTLFGELL